MDNPNDPRLDPASTSSVIDRYQQYCQSGATPDLVDFVASGPALNPRDLAALVHVDQRHRHAAGATLPAESYFESFPALRKDTELALDVVYQEYVLRRDAGEAYSTDKYLSRFPDLAEQLAMQFDLDGAMGDEHSSRSMANPRATVEQSPAYPPGTIIAGRYKLLEEIGEGGMGTVWVAQQTEPVRRRVALKLIKPGMDSRQVLSRFEAERQALAMMDHPHIAKVLDGGMTDQGRPYFVMEYVKGEPITDYCDHARLSVKERLKLFVQVCQAVQHAHQKGIIHRDLKPSNILVCPYDGQPVPKVIDFGLAKAMHQSLTEHSLYTAHGVMVGTPLYMSPEQAETNNLDIDTRSDLYSLGVILYELLTGSTPLEKRRLHDAAFQEMLRLIKEEEPPKPSTRLSGSGSLPTIAAQRSLEPAQLSRAVRGDLDWIVMKSLEKDRSRRYETANGLARDIERYLHDDPVEARPPSVGYRFSKFARRNKAALVTIGLVAAALVAGTMVSTWQAIRATRAERLADARLITETVARRAADNARAAEVEQRTEAEGQRKQAESNEKKALSEANKSRQVAQFLKDMLNAASPGVASGRDTTLLREIVDTTAQRIGNNDLKDQPEVEAELRRTLGWVYEILGEYDQAEAMFRQAVTVGKKHFGDEHPDLPSSLDGLGLVLTRQEKLGEAETTFREALAVLGKLPQTQDYDLAFSLNGLAAVLLEQRKLPEAETMFREALAIRRKLLGNDDPMMSNTLANLAAVLGDQGKLAEAELMFREALAIGRKHSGTVHDTTIKLWNLAPVLQQQGKLAEAEAMYREALAMQRSLIGNEHPFVAGMLEGLAGVLHEQGKFAEAETIYREVLARRRKAVESMPNSPGELRRLARILATCPFNQLRDPGQAVQLATRATELAPQAKPCWIALGVAQYRAGQWQGANEALGRSLELSGGGDATDWFFLAMAHWQLDHKDEARKWYDQSVEWMEKNQPKNEELVRFRAEAEELLGISQPSPAPNDVPQGEATLKPQS